MVNSSVAEDSSDMENHTAETEVMEVMVETVALPEMAEVADMEETEVQAEMAVAEEMADMLDKANLAKDLYTPELFIRMSTWSLERKC